MNGGPARVLEALRRADGRSCSGETLSSEQGISRAQIWKHVQALRARGYTIEGEAGEGYHLAGVPDRLYPEEIQARLRTSWLAQRLEWLEETDSTNRVATDLAREGAAHGTTVVAECQTAGRGRLGRTFYSPPYQNIYTSILLRPALTTDAAPAWILAAAVAVAETVAETLGDDDAVEIKWPNDVLVGGRKTSGILMELGAEATRVAWLVLGIGVNLNVDRETFPDEFRAQATSLASHAGQPVDRAAFAARLYERLEEVLDACAARGAEAVRGRFERRFRMGGHRVTVRGMDGTDLRGVVQGIDAVGGLRLRDEAGMLHTVLAGDVTLEQEAS